MEPTTTVSGHSLSLPQWVAVLILATATFFSAPLSHAAEPPQQSPDGLELRKVKGVAIVYVRPGATLKGYKRLMLDPVEVAFDKSFTREHREVHADDRERIRRQLAEEFRRAFTEELEEKGGYEIVEFAAPDVLRVSAAIVDLYITAPDTMQAGRSRAYTVSPGRMTLIAELRDSETGAILARAADRKSGSTMGPMQLTTRTSNLADARRALNAWAQVLHKALDSARSAAP